MEIEQRVENLEVQLKKTQLVAGIALGLAIAVAAFAFVQLMSN